MMEHEVKTKTLFQNVSFKWQRRNSLQSALIDLILVRMYDGYRLESVNLNMAPPWDDPLHVDENVLFKSFFVYLCKTVLKIKYLKSRNYLFFAPRQKRAFIHFKPAQSKNKKRLLSVPIDGDKDQFNSSTEWEEIWTK